VCPSWQDRPCGDERRQGSHAGEDATDGEKPEFDSRLGTPGLHDVNRRVTPTERQSILPPDLFRRWPDALARTLEITSGGNGWVSIKGFFDSAGGATVRKALEPLARKAGADDKREREQRLADALVQLATGAKPAQLQVTASIETLMGLAGAPAGEMEFSLPISAKTVERMACDCSVVRVLLGADSAVIDVGRSTRKISAGLRRGIKARDGGCRWPGCDRPAYWSEAHHLQHWIQGGATEPDNLVLLCYHHHRKVHEGGWQLVKTDDGRLLTIAPPMRFTRWSRGPD